MLVSSERLKHYRNCFPARSAEAVDTETVEPLEAFGIDFKNSETWCDLPDVIEGNAGKDAAPTTGMRDATDQSEDVVAQSLAHVEALVGVEPDTITCMGPLWFC